MIDAYKYKDIVYRIIGAAMHVHKVLRWGLLEAVYQEALSWELEEREIKNLCQEEIRIYYGKHLLKKRYRMDIVVGDVVVELKSTSRICSAHRAQLCNYLRLTKKPVGILINFGQPEIQGERWVLDEETNVCTLVDKAMNPVYPEEDLFNDGTIEKREELENHESNSEDIK